MSTHQSSFSLTASLSRLAVAPSPAGKPTARQRASPPMAGRGMMWVGTNRLVWSAPNPPGQLLGTSAPLTITPRPVVMVHGFAAVWEVWSAYLGDNGFLRTNDLQGFAVGDGQVAGVMNVGDKRAPLTPTNTIAQNAEVLATISAMCNRSPGRSKSICWCIAWAASLPAIISTG